MRTRLGLRPPEARRERPKGRAALRRGAGGAQPGVVPRPVWTCSCGSAAAPASKTYRGKPNEWTRIVQRMGPRRIWLTRPGTASGHLGSWGRIGMAVVATSALRGA